MGTPIDLSIIDRLPVSEQAELLKLVKKLERAEKREAAQNSFLGFVKEMWPAFIEGRHHRIMAKAIDRIISGDLKRLIVNIGPRFTKSKFFSEYLPAKYLGHYPERKVIEASHTADLAVSFGRDVRNTIATKAYQDIFPGTKLSVDAKAAGHWITQKGGTYFALGIGANVAGKGADLFIVDDPHSEQDYLRSKGGDMATFDDVYDWFTSGPRQRLQPDAAIVVVMTRWSKRDLTGRLIKAMTDNPHADQWEIIEFPALMPDTDAPLWPEYWTYELLSKTRATLPPAQWNAQYLQNPTSEEGALGKRNWWKIWDHTEPPKCEFIIQAWDTAFLKTQQADYSACTTWGVFYLPDDEGKKKANIILLDAYKDRLEFPQLKKKAYEMWKSRQPDAFIVEGKASGMPLIFELRAMGIPVSDFTPHRGTRTSPNDKLSRVNGITDLFASGMVWCPQTRWAEEVIEEFAAFPRGDHDNYDDTGVMALTRFRQGGFLRLASDFEDKPKVRRVANYY